MSHILSVVGLLPESRSTESYELVRILFQILYENSILRPCRHDEALSVSSLIPSPELQPVSGEGNKAINLIVYDYYPLANNPYQPPWPGRCLFDLPLRQLIRPGVCISLPTDADPIQC